MMLDDLKLVSHDQWVQEWTAFYWSNWYAWAGCLDYFWLGFAMANHKAGYLVQLGRSCAGLWCLGELFWQSCSFICPGGGDILLTALSKDRPESVTFLLLERLWEETFNLVFIFLVAMCFVTAAILIRIPCLGSWCGKP